MERYKMHIVRSADKRVSDFLKNQVKVSGRPDFGGLRGDIIEAKPTIYVLTTRSIKGYKSGDGFRN
ncbi:MAG: hypothetical protein K0R05_1358 [Anaerocolumna sp.]|nr:hypothetical protein [Anaerocolumna sp.]